MIARRSSIIMQNLVEIDRRMSAWEDEVWCFLAFFVNNAPALNAHNFTSDAVALFKKFLQTECPANSFITEGKYKKLYDI